MDRRERLLRAAMRSAQAHDARLRINSDRQAGIRRVVTDRVASCPSRRSPNCARWEEFTAEMQQDYRAKVYADLWRWTRQQPTRSAA